MANYKDEWRLLAISDNLDDVEHRPLTEEFLFYQAVATGDVEAVRKNCEQERFVSEDGVGTLSRNPITNLKRVLKSHLFEFHVACVLCNQ